MSKYLFAYHGGKPPETQEAMADMMDAWKSWLDSLEEKLIDPGNPAGPSKILNGDLIDDNGGSNPVSGYTLIRADDMDSALEIAKSCPHRHHGTIEVAELMELDL